MNIDLLAPRFEVIADYPRSAWTVGRIIEGYFLNDLLKSEVDMRKYPKIFRPLCWWEKRKPEEVESVKYLKNIKTLAVHEVVEYSAMFGYMSGVRSEFKSATPEYSLNHFYEMRDLWVPATLTDYTTYINQSKK